MWMMRAVMMGVALTLLGGTGEAFAQVLLHEQQQRAEQAAEERINDLRARASCHDQQAAARRQIWPAYSGNDLRSEDRKERDAQLQEADQRFRECLDQLQAGVLRDVCRTVARTDAQRARCE